MTEGFVIRGQLVAVRRNTLGQFGRRPGRDGDVRDLDKGEGACAARMDGGNVRAVRKHEWQAGPEVLFDPLLHRALNKGCKP